MMRNLAFAIGGLIIVIVGVFLFTNKTKSDNDTIMPTPVSFTSPTPDLSTLEPGKVQSENKKMQVPFQILNKEEIEGKKVKVVTSEGDIVFELFSDSPIAASNFIYLVNKKFFDGLIFHRVIKGFMIQGGDPQGSGTGGPGYNFPDEKVASPYKRGIVAMANAGPNTNGSQFFIMHNDYQLPPSYTIFGNVISGMEVVDKITAAQVDENDKPQDTITMTTVTIE